MTMDLTEIAAPAHTAIVTQELQGAVVGPNAGLGALAKAAQRQALPNIERLLPVHEAQLLTYLRFVDKRLGFPLPDPPAQT